MRTAGAVRFWSRPSSSCSGVPSTVTQINETKVTTRLMKEISKESTDLTIGTLVFQDALHSSEDISTTFFNLANASEISYRIDGHDVDQRCLGDDRTDHYKSPDRRNQRKRKKSETINCCVITVKQDVSACLQHTGGIVWETSYLLLTYLIELCRQQKQECFGTRILELGAGCGLLGQGLGLAVGHENNSSHSDKCFTVVVTECQDAYDNLQTNVQKNRDVMREKAPRAAVVSCVLDWLHVEHNIVANHGLLQTPFDTIVATDVLFSPKLVLPLLNTMKRLSYQFTTIYLCVQIRCAMSHALFLEKAFDYGFDVANISESVYKVKGCEWGEEMECLVFRMALTEVIA